MKVWVILHSEGEYDGNTDQLIMNDAEDVDGLMPLEYLAFSTKELADDYVNEHYPIQDQYSYWEVVEVYVR